MTRNRFTLAAGLSIAVVVFTVGCGANAASTPKPSVGATSQTSTSPPGSAMSLPVADCQQGSITVGGSTAMQPVVEAAKESYEADCSGASIDVQGGGSGTGLSQAAAGVFQIGDSDVTAESKLATPDAAKLVDHQVLKQGFVMVTNKDVTGVTNLTTDQAKQIWTGAITNWKDVGGNDEGVTLIIRPESSGTRAVFKSIVLAGAAEAQGQALTEDSNGAITQAVTSTPGSTSYIGFAYYQQNKDNLTALQLDSVDATIPNLTSGMYKLQSTGHMYTNGEPTGLAKSFIDFMTSDGVQHQLIPSLFYAPLQ
jgi:phosphate transport system substrate-binding protein